MRRATRATILQDQQRQRWQQGDRIPVEAYLEQHPALRSDPEALLDLIYNEMVLREEQGDPPRLDDYLHRFPQFASQLRLQFEVHQALEGGSLSVGSQLQVEQPPASELVGRILGDFRIERCLGEGGMGRVYLAEQVSLKRPVALKVLRPDLAADPAYLQRFRAEAEVAARATHPHIVQVYAIDQHAGLHYMALEYVEGRSLREHLDRTGPLPPPLALTVMRQVASALERAGELGIVHRDIKPDNLLLTCRGEVKVADFGLARDARTTGRRLTRQGATPGTPLYMSPEQFQGRIPEPRSDIYSFGVTCYHLLAGRPPFTGDSVYDLALQHLEHQPPLLHVARPDLPAAVCDLVHRMMAKRPEERPQNGGELLREVERAWAAAPSQPSARRRWWLWVAAACIPLLLGLAFAGSLAMGRFWHRAEESPDKVAPGPAPVAQPQHSDGTAKGAPEEKGGTVTAPVTSDRNNDRGGHGRRRRGRDPDR